MSVTDATGRATTFPMPYQVGRSSSARSPTRSAEEPNLPYDANGRLNQITDILGLKSQFTYDASSLVNAMTTPMARRHSPTGRAELFVI